MRVSSLKNRGYFGGADKAEKVLKAKVALPFSHDTSEAVRPCVSSGSGFNVTVKTAFMSTSALTAVLAYRYLAMRRDVMPPAVTVWLSSVPVVPSLKL